MMERSLISFTKETTAVYGSDKIQTDLRQQHSATSETNTTTPDDDTGQTDN
jgi:hypothetical protein